MSEKREYSVITDKWLYPYRVAISLKEAGDMGISIDENNENRRRLFSELNIREDRVFRNRQIHSDIILKPDRKAIHDADGLVSDNPKDALMLLTADCYNVFFTTAGGKSFGAVHAGWKGIAAGIIERARDIFKGETRVLVAQGICKRHFTVDADVAEIFERRFGSEYIERGETINVNLRGIINGILKDTAEITNLDFCTVCDNDRFFSYREGNKSERNLSIIWRDDE